MSYIRNLNFMSSATKQINSSFVRPASKSMPNYYKMTPKLDYYYTRPKITFIQLCPVALVHAHGYATSRSQFHHTERTQVWMDGLAASLSSRSTFTIKLSVASPHLMIFTKRATTNIKLRLLVLDRVLTKKK